MIEKKMQPRGRRSGQSDTRQAILLAAQTLFATQGYSKATIRNVAAAAAVDPALVMQFYKSKDELFAASIALSAGGLSKVAKAFDAPRADLGHNLAEGFLSLWEADDADGAALLAMLRCAASDDTAASRFREFFQSRLSEVIGPKLKDMADGELRAGLAAAMLLGVIFTRKIVQVPVMSGRARDAIVQIIAPAIQAIFEVQHIRPQTN